MKKILLLALMSLAAITAKAQFYVGGEVGLQANKDLINLRILPEAGYNLNDKMAVGGKLGVSYYKDTEWDDINNFAYTMETVVVTLSPYFRYTFLDLGPVKLFADGQVDLDIYTYPGSGAKPYVDWGIGVSPGFAIPLNNNLSFVGHLGRFGYYNGAFDISLDMSSIDVGVFYNF